MKCEQHPEVEMTVTFKGGFGSEREFRCPECEKEEAKKVNRSIYLTSRGGWQ